MPHIIATLSSLQPEGLALFEISLVAIPPFVILGKLQLTERKVLALLLYVLVGCWAFIPSVRPLYSLFADHRWFVRGFLLALVALLLFRKFQERSSTA